MKEPLKLTLAELLNHYSDVIKRHAMGIFKELQRIEKSDKNMIELDKGRAKNEPNRSNNKQSTQ